MSNHDHQSLSSLLLAALLIWLFTAPVNAASIQSLISEDRLSIQVRLKSIAPIIAKQPVLFEVEVATDRWFAKGTYLTYPSVKDAVMLPADGFGVNGTKKRNGATWVTQTREITLYPTLAGDYKLPPVEVQVSVNTENSGVVEGSFYTKPLSFSVIVPEALQQYESYIVSPDVQLDISLEAGDGVKLSSAAGRADESEYAVGEAIRQTVTLSATSVPGMMLPSLTVPDIDGLSIYHKPARLNDTSSRGELRGIRIDSLTYIFEQAGDYEIPGQTFYWWNDATQELAELTIPARKWHVTGVSLSDSGASIKPFRFLPTMQQLSVAIMIGAGCLLIGLLYHYREKLLAGYAQLTKLHYRTRRKAFLTAIERNQYPLACEILYQLVNPSADTVCSLQSYYALEADSLVVLGQLLDAAYGNGDSKGHIDIANAYILLRRTAQVRQRLHANELVGRLQLNPAN